MTGSDADESAPAAPTFEDALRAGVAVYNAGGHHAAHDAWEARWLDLERGTDDERFLHGLIQFTAAVYHARHGNWSGATGLAASADGYLDGLPETHRGVDLDAVRASLRALRADPERVERGPPPALPYDGARLTLEDLDFGAAAVAARVLAEEQGYDAAVLDRAVAYAREELAGDTETRFISLVMDFAADPVNRPLVFRRLREHVERRRTRETDVEGLFDEE